jgi:hypothetical protein
MQLWNPCFMKRIVLRKHCVWSTKKIFTLHKNPGPSYGLQLDCAHIFWLSVTKIPSVRIRLLIIVDYYTPHEYESWLLLLLYHMYHLFNGNRFDWILMYVTLSRIIIVFFLFFYFNITKLWLYFQRFAITVYYGILNFTEYTTPLDLWWANPFSNIIHRPFIYI